MQEAGRIIRVNGPLILAKNVPRARVGDVVHLGNEKLIGEIVRIKEEIVAIQCYEDTSGLRPGEPVINTYEPLVAELGPGLLGQIFDGLEFSEIKLHEVYGPFIKRGVKIERLDRNKKWEFTPRVKVGDEVTSGDILGVVQETELIEHRILVPIPLETYKPIEGRIKEIYEGKFKITDTVAIIETKDGQTINISMLQKWPVRIPRPYKARLKLEEPLITGQRVIDTFFPIAKGGTAAIPGGFGTGKCVLPGTPVLLANGELVPIEKFYDMAKNIVRNGDEEIGKLENVYIVSFDGSKLVFKKATHIYKGRTDKIVRVRTRSGREINVTPAHKLITFNPHGYFEQKSAIYLNEGEYLVVPRKIPIVNDCSYREINIYEILPEARVRDIELYKDMKDLIDSLAQKIGGKRKLAKALGVSYNELIGYYVGKSNPTVKFIARLYDLAKQPRPRISKLAIARSNKVINIPNVFNEEFAEFLGLLLSDGMITARELRFFNNNTTLLNRFKELSARLFGVESREKYFRTVKGLVIDSVVLIMLLKRLGVPLTKKSRNITVPKIVLMSPSKVIAAFIKGYYLGDGSFDKSVITISSASKTFINGLAYLLSRLGILYRISEKINRRKYHHYQLVISGIKEMNKFAEIVLSDAPMISKVSQINKYISSRSARGGIKDVVPLEPSTLRELVEEFSRGYLEKQGVWIRNYTELGERLSSVSLLKLASVTREEKLINIANALEWVYLDPIERVDVIEGNRVVYDITVEETHNFVGGEIPTILHNTVTLQQLAKWSDADIIIYIGCGERGNEMADVIDKFPKLKDPRTGRLLIERSVFIANVSNLPVYARESSIYLGVTIGEYFRDQGYSVAIMADSTSRWAEALRDISGRLEEIPAERGFPAYLAERIAEFYERAGRVIAYGKDNRVGSLTIMGAVSPPGGDFSEPVTSITLRFVEALWALDKELAFKRHFPAINWLMSFSKYNDTLKEYWERIDPDFTDLRNKAISLLEEASKIEQIARIVGEKSLPEDQRLILLASEIIREGFLVQNAFHPVDTFCPPDKQATMLRAIMEFYSITYPLVEKGIPVERIRGLKVKFLVPGRESEEELSLIMLLERMKEWSDVNKIDELRQKMREAIRSLAEEYGL